MAQVCLNCGAPPNFASLLEPQPTPSLDLTHLLTSNEPPPDSEVPLIRDIISESQSRIGPLDAHIETLQAQIRSLETTLAEFVERREETVELVRQHQSIVSPARRMPAELICHILALTWEAYKDTTNGPPWYLGHICRLWRHSVLLYPNLWSSITVPSFKSSEGSHLLSSIEAQLVRSADVPLDLYWPSVQSEVDPRLLDLVFRHCRRWRSLHFHDPAQHRDRMLHWLRPVDGQLDQLQKLTLVSHSGMFVGDVFATAPNLREVILTDGVSSYSPEGIVIRWGQITHYRGTYAAPRQFNILRAAPNLVECDLGFTNVDFDPDASMIDLPNLRRLSSDYVAFLEYLTAPILDDLRLTLGGEQLVPLLPFIHRSSCTLTRLALTELIAIDVDAMSTLRELPSLTYLLLEYASDADIDAYNGLDWINAMFVSGAPSDICPDLATLVVGYTDADQLPFAFFEMVRSRFQSNRTRSSHLECLRIFDAGSLTALSDEALAQMNGLREEELDVALVEWEDGVQLKKDLL
ncbi:hypothetical protein MVEN_00301000 [Mycena venus]|uniref:F-box domain-containing protein n=1 Tax=Mycena venus TaxID=2733690 RepID=A0A8H6Z4F9_9AGAR|nr:hypothetical protein MVEN_00301000 [Mycena venus]